MREISPLAVPQLLQKKLYRRKGWYDLANARNEGRRCDVTLVWSAYVTIFYVYLTHAPCGGCIQSRSGKLSRLAARGLSVTREIKCLPLIKYIKYIPAKNYRQKKWLWMGRTKSNCRRPRTIRKRWSLSLPEVGTGVSLRWLSYDNLYSAFSNFHSTVRKPQSWVFGVL